MIEVAHASRGRDLGLKASLYAAAGVPDYWVVDLVGGDIVVHREPVGSSFASVNHHRDGAVRPLHYPAAVVDVAELLR